MTSTAPADKKMSDIVALCKRRGFLFQSSEIYGGLNGFWDYGPLGVELKRNVRGAWWRDMVSSHNELLKPASAPEACGLGYIAMAKPKKAVAPQGVTHRPHGPAAPEERALGRFSTVPRRPLRPLRTRGARRTAQPANTARHACPAAPPRARRRRESPESDYAPSRS